MSTETEIETMTQYLRLKVAERDWHAVSDAANDLREIEAAATARRRLARELVKTQEQLAAAVFTLQAIAQSTIPGAPPSQDGFAAQRALGTIGEISLPEGWKIRAAQSLELSRAAEPRPPRPRPGEVIWTTGPLHESKYPSSEGK